MTQIRTLMVKFSRRNMLAFYNATFYFFLILLNLKSLKNENIYDSHLTDTVVCLFQQKSLLTVTSVGH